MYKLAPPGSVTTVGAALSTPPSPVHDPLPCFTWSVESVQSTASVAPDEGGDVGEATGVLVFVLVGLGTAVFVGVGTTVFVGVGMAVLVGVGSDVRVGVGMAVLVGVTVGVGVVVGARGVPVLVGIDV